MASALMNMMVDEESKSKQSGQPVPTGTPQGAGQPNTPQMPPPSPVVGAPAQVENGGVGAQPQTQQPAGPDPLSLLALGQGPIAPSRAPAARRAVQRRGATPAPTPVPEPVEQTPTYVDPEFSGPLREDPTIKPVRGQATPGLNRPVSGLDASYNAQTQQIEQQFNTGAITVQERDRQLNALQQNRDTASGLPSLNKVITEGAPQDQMTLTDKLYLQFDVLANAYDPTRQSETQMGFNIDISDRILKQVQSPTAAINPAMAIRTVHKEYSRKIAALEAQRAAILRGDTSEILKIMPDISPDGPMAQILQEFPGANIQQTLARAQNETGWQADTERINEYSKDAVANIDRQIADIRDSDAYKALDNAQQLMGTVTGSRAQQIAKSVIGYSLYLQNPDSQQGRQARNYALSARMAGAKGVAFTESATSFEDMAAKVPGLERIFTRGEVKGLYTDAQRAARQETYVEQLIGASGSNMLRQGSTGKKLSPARSGEQGLISAFLNPIINPTEGAARPGWASGLIRNVSRIVPIIDPNFENIMNMQDGRPKQVMLTNAAAGYQIKSNLEQLFKFDYSDNPDAFAIDSVNVTNALNAGDPITAAKGLAPYSSTDQLISLFGEDVVIKNNIVGQKPSTLLPYDLSRATGFAGARKARIDAYKARMEGQARGEQRVQGTNFKIGSGKGVIAALGASYGVPSALLGLTGSNEEVKSAYDTFSGGLNEESATQQRGMIATDLESMLRPAMNDKGEYVPDSIWSDSVESLDNTIFQLENNIDTGIVASDRLEGAKFLLSELKSARDNVRADLETGIEIGGERGYLFGQTAGKVDYSKPVRAASGTGRTAQAVDMLQAWVSGTPGLDINRYFKTNAVTGTRANMQRVVGYAVTEDGTPIRSKPVRSTSAEDIVRVPVFRQTKNGYEPVLNAAGTQAYQIQPQDLTVEISSKILATATNDQTTVGVDKNYVRMQINDLKSHIEKIIYGYGGEDKDGNVVLTDAQREFARISGLEVYDTMRVDGFQRDVLREGKINTAEFTNYLQNLDKYQGRQLIGFLNQFGENLALAPDARVRWAMNASSSRGKATDISDRAISNIERDATAKSKSNSAWQYSTGWQSLTATAKKVVYDLDMNLSYDAEGGPDVKASQVDRIVKQVLEAHPYVRDGQDGGSAMMREQLRAYAGALYDDDAPARIKIHRDTEALIDQQASQEAPALAEQDIVDKIRSTRVKADKPDTGPQLSNEEKLRAASEAFQARSAQNRKQQMRAVTLFFPKLGWISAQGTQDMLDIWKDIDTSKVNSATAIETLETTAKSYRPARRQEIQEAMMKSSPGMRIVKDGDKVRLRPRNIPPKPAAAPTTTRQAVQLPRTGVQMPKINVGNNVKNTAFGLLSLAGAKTLNDRSKRGR
jgi:hypothetical protein